MTESKEDKPVYYVWAINDLQKETPAGVWSATLEQICREFCGPHARSRFSGDIQGPGKKTKRTIEKIRYEQRVGDRLLGTGFKTKAEMRMMHLTRLRTLRPRS